MKTFYYLFPYLFYVYLYFSEHELPIKLFSDDNNETNVYKGVAFNDIKIREIKILKIKILACITPLIIGFILYFLYFVTGDESYFLELKVFAIVDLIAPIFIFLYGIYEYRITIDMFKSV